MEIVLRVFEEAKALFQQIEEEDGMTLEKAPIFNEALTIGLGKILGDMRQKKHERIKDGDS